MRAASALIRAALNAPWVALGACVSCAAAAHGTPIGMSDAPPERVVASPSETPRAAWGDFAAARAWPVAGSPFVSQGHRRDGALVRVAVEPPSLAAYGALAAEAPMPDGARVIAWHEAPTGQLLGGYLLEKRGGAWSALEVDGKGAIVPADHARCLRCHDMAPTDHLFGLWAVSAPSPVGGESIDPLRR